VHASAETGWAHACVQHGRSASAARRAEAVSATREGHTTRRSCRFCLTGRRAAVRGIGRSGRRCQRTRTRGRAKWSDWPSVAHGRTERGCVGRTRSPRSVARLAAGRVEADGSSGDDGMWRGRLIQGSCLRMLVLSDVAVRVCNDGHARRACAKRQVAEAPLTAETRREGVGLAWLSTRGCPDKACRHVARPGIAAQRPACGGSGAV
jgi:hypothetical protein